MLKKVLWFVGGAITGSVVTYFVTTKMIEKGLDEFKDDFAAGLDNDLRRRRQERTARVKRVFRDNFEDSYEEQNGLPKLEYKTHLANYESAATSEDENVQDPGPYLITVDEFHDGMENHEQLTIRYYPDDDTLIDDQDVIIDERIMLIGHDALLQFGMGSMDPDVVYIRNRDLMIDYEIVKTYGYCPQNEVEPLPPKKIRRRKKIDELRK